jgi:hypothetical protein
MSIAAIPNFFKQAAEDDVASTLSGDEKAKKKLLPLVEKHRKNPDLPGGGPASSLPRTAIPRKALTIPELKALGFAESLVAVPEIGQKRLTTYRHPQNNLHLHDHGKNWFLHEDNFPSAQMIKLRRQQERGEDSTLLDRVKDEVVAVAQGLPHAVREGIPGTSRYLYGVATGAPTFQERLQRKSASGAVLGSLAGGAIGGVGGYFLGGRKKRNAALGILGGAAAGGGLGYALGKTSEVLTQAVSEGPKQDPGGYGAPRLDTLGNKLKTNPAAVKSLSLLDVSVPNYGKALQPARAYREANRDLSFLQDISDAAVTRKVPLDVPTKLGLGNGRGEVVAGAQYNPRTDRVAVQADFLKQSPKSYALSLLHHELVHAGQPAHSGSKPVPSLGKYHGSQDEVEAYLAQAKHDHFAGTGEVIDTPAKAKTFLQNSENVFPKVHRTPTLRGGNSLLRELQKLPPAERTEAIEELSRIIPGVVKNDTPPNLFQTGGFSAGMPAFA